MKSLLRNLYNKYWIVRVMYARWAKLKRLVTSSKQTSSSSGSQQAPVNKPIPAPDNWPSISFTPFKRVERLDQDQINTLLDSVGRRGKTLATLIIGIRAAEDSPERIDNLKFLLEWIDYHYQSLFDVLILEQDDKSRIDLEALNAKPYVRHEYLYNDREYNRGWGYNVAVCHYCKESDVVVMMDTDVLTGSGFITGIVACHNEIDACSPYTNVYYTDISEADQLRREMSLSCLTNEKHVLSPVTFSGGVVIFKRSSYLAIKGYEQYVGYACEDRAMDVTVLNHFEPTKVLVLPEIYVHLYHPIDKGARMNSKEIFEHLHHNYGCRYHREIAPFDYIHGLCTHASPETTSAMLVRRARSFGDPDLYQSGSKLTINGQITHESVLSTQSEQDLIFPTEFDSLDNYEIRELYPGTDKPDVEGLAAFFNLYRGERCFIIGNGPSLNSHDLSLLEGEYSFGVNSFYYKTRETGFTPTFYVVEDSSVMKENVKEIVEYDAPFKFFPTIYRGMHPEIANAFFFEMNRGFYEKSSPNYVVPRFSTDASKVLYCGQSVTYINLQLAFFMGFTEVHLIGMDFDYVIPDTHKRHGDILLSDTDDPNHFHKDYFGKGKTWKDPKLERVELNYRQAKLSYEAVGRKIYNATIGGKLEVFDRSDYEIMLRDPETGMKRTKRLAKVPLLSKNP